MDNRYDEANAKLAAQEQMLGKATQGTKSYYGDTCGVQEARSRPTPAEQAEKNAAFHIDEHIRAQKAASFLRANPAFDEFIQLVRLGIIQF